MIKMVFIGFINKKMQKKTTFLVNKTIYNSKKGFFTTIFDIKNIFI